VTLPIAVVLIAALGAGCDPGSFATPATPADCVAIGARCQLPDGPIGVCQEAPCGAGATPPCFACTPQH
jgi:hypothetical protein